MADNPVKKTGPDFDVVVVKSTRQARALLRYMNEIAFASEQPRTVSEFASLRRISLAAASYRVRQLAELGLLHPQGQSGRGQRYAAPHQWQIPQEFIAQGSLKEFMMAHFGGQTEQVFGGYEQHWRGQTQAWTLQLDFKRLDYFQIKVEDAPTLPPLIVNPVLMLSQRQAQALHDELLAVLSRYTEPEDGPEIKTYYAGVFLGLAPR